MRHPFSPAGFAEIAERYNAAFTDYRRGDFAEAEQNFAALYDDTKDPPSALMAARCRELRASPEKEWNGIYELKTK